MSVRVRFAPSPTGQLHVGNARTALFNWLFARRARGVFVLRIEDTDVERQQAGAEESIYEDLAWMGLDWDEGPFRQSERRASYLEALRRLEERGAAYPCFCTDAELESDRAGAQAAGRTPGYVGRCARLPQDRSAARRAAGEPHAWRFRVGSFGVVQDALRGPVDFRSREAFDPVIVRRDGRPTYNFAVVVDDAEMRITHVLRGEDHLTNTALQVRLYEALDLALPFFAHLPLIMGPDGTPLSKRHGATSVGEMRAHGYPPLALVNALARLGWTPPAELDERKVMTVGAMAAAFDLARVHANPATFDLAKLNWLSGEAIRAMPSEERAREVGTWLKDPLAGTGSDRDAWLRSLGDLLSTSLEHFDQIPGKTARLLEFDPAHALAAGALGEEGSRRVLETFAGLLEKAGPLTSETLTHLIARAKDLTGMKGRALLHPLRAAVTGQESGPDLTRLLPVIDGAARLGIGPDPSTPADRIRRVLQAA